MRRRTLLISGGLVVAVIGIFALAGRGGSDGPTAVADTPPAETTVTVTHTVVRAMTATTTAPASTVTVTTTATTSAQAVTVTAAAAAGDAAGVEVNPPAAEPAPAPRPLVASPGGSAYYANCTAARAAGAAPLYAGEPGYRGALDRDNDGIACE